MALVPCHNDPDFKNQMEHCKANPDSWARGAQRNNDTPVARVMRRLAAHYGLSPINSGQTNLIAQKLLADAKGDEAKVQVENARAELVERGLLS
jgi:hypothetical protein